MKILSILMLIVATLTNRQVASVETKPNRSTANLFDPLLSARTFYGRIKENQRTVQVEPRISATDADRSTTLNGKICGYELSWHKHDEISNRINEQIPFVVEIVNNEPVLKLKTDLKTLDCEARSIYRLFIRAFDCGTGNSRRYSERSSLTIIVDDVNEYAPVFTHSSYNFKLHQNENCDSSSCRVEATDDDCSIVDHRVCGYEILDKNVPFSINQNGSISITRKLTERQYDFNVVAYDCNPKTDGTKSISDPAHVTFKIIEDCSPRLIDSASKKLTIQSDRIHLFDTVRVDTCDETCQVEDIVATVTIDANGLDSGCNVDQCTTINREHVLLPKDLDVNRPPKSEIRSFDGYTQAMVIDKTTFSGEFSEQFTIRMWMKHSAEEDSSDKHHVFCKSDNKLKNRHHTALFIQNNQLKLLVRKGPLATNEKEIYESEWVWRVPQINDNEWHSYRIVAHYPTKIELYIDDKLIVHTEENFQLIKDHALTVIDGTEGTVFALGACWHGRASRMVQHFRGQLSALTIERNEEIDRASNCIQDCKQYIEVVDMEKGANIEFASNSNRSMWILRTDAADSYEQLLKHVVYRNKFQPLGPTGERTVTIDTQIKCAGESHAFKLPSFTRSISIDEPIRVPVKVEMKAENSYVVPENVMSRGIYLFRNLSIYTNILEKSQADINECTVNTNPIFAPYEQLIIPSMQNLETLLTQNGAKISGLDTIDRYQYLLRQIAFVSKTPITNEDRLFRLSCITARDQATTNEIRVRVRIQKQSVPLPPVAAARSSKLEVSNDHIRDNVFDVENKYPRTARNVSDWPIAAVICVAIGLAGVLVLYVVVRVRSNKRQHSPMSHNADDLHSQMEWEDDIGLNITVNPLDETKKPVPSANIHPIGQTMHTYSGASSDDDECDHDGHNQDDYSSEDEEDYEEDRARQAKLEHQLEWDDAAIEYGPKKV